MIILANVKGEVGMQIAANALREGKSALDAIELGIRPVEADPNVSTVGRGSAPNALGEMELDASIMNGVTLETGAIGALKGFLHPISIAREVMRRLPHVFLVGEGAARFAKEIGAEEAELLTDSARADYEKWLDARLSAEQKKSWPNIPLSPLAWPADPTTTKGTTTFLVQDAQGILAGGVSTSGWPYKYPGRLGDSPVIGAGMYVDNRYGGAACTHTGEMTIRAATSRSVVLYMKKGATVEEASREACEDLAHLQGGHLGTVVVHAVDTKGNFCVLTHGRKEPEPFWLWQDHDALPRELNSLVF